MIAYVRMYVFKHLSVNICVGINDGKIRFDKHSIIISLENKDVVSGCGKI